MATFAKIKMVSEDVTAYDITGKFMSNSQLAEVEDGAFVVVGDLMKSTVYSGKDYNVFEIKAPAAATDEVAVVDIFKCIVLIAIAPESNSVIKTYIPQLALDPECVLSSEI